MGLDELIVAGSHGFDIWSPSGGAIQRQEGGEFDALLAQVTEKLRTVLGSVNGALIEPKRSSVAVHYRLVEASERARVKEVVDRTLAEHPDGLKVTPGKMVFEIQPKIDWDKGKAVLHLLEALGLDGPGVVPLYIGDDITDEHAFEAISGRGLGILVADSGDPERVRADDRGRLRPSRPGRGAAAARPARRARRARRRQRVAVALRRLRAGRGGLARDAHLDRQRLLLPARRRRVGGLGRHPLRGHLRARRLQPRDDDHGRAPGAQRGHGQPAQRPRAQAARRGGGAVLAGQRRAAVLPARVRLPRRAGRPRAALPRSRRARDDTSQPALREHGSHAPDGARLGRSCPRTGRAAWSSSRRSTGACSTTASPATASSGAATWIPQAPRTYGTDVIALKVRTRQSRIEIAEAARTRVYVDGRELPAERSTYQTEDYIQQVLSFDVRRACRFASRSSSGSTRRATAPSPSRSRTPGHSVARYTRLRRRPRGAPARLGGAVGRLRPARPARAARPVPPAAAHLPRPPGVLAAHRPPRRGRARAGSQRRGVPRARVLGRAVRVSVPELPLPGDHARPAALPLPAHRGGARRRRGGRLPRRDVPVAERQRRHRGDADRPPQPAVGPLGPGPQPQPAPRQRRALLQRLAVLPGDPRRRLPARLRRRDDDRDRALLGLDRALQPGARAVGDPRRDGPGRVPREVPGRGARAGCATTPTRTSWSPGSATSPHRVLDLLPASRRDALRRRTGLQRRGDPRLGGHRADGCSCRSSRTAS